MLLYKYLNTQILPHRKHNILSYKDQPLNVAYKTNCCLLSIIWSAKPQCLWKMYTFLTSQPVHVHRHAISSVPTVLWPTRKMKQIQPNKLLAIVLSFIYNNVTQNGRPLPRRKMLQPICYRGTQLLQGNLSRCFQEWSLKAVQVLEALSAIHILQNNRQIIVKVVEVWPPLEPNFVANKGRKVPCIHSWIILVWWAGAEFCWKIHFCPLNTVVLRGFTTPCSTYSCYTMAPAFTHFSQK